MDDDEDNDEREDDNFDQDEENPKRTFNKKKYFGRTTRDVRLLNMRACYKPTPEFLKAFKITLENSISSIGSIGAGRPLAPLKIKVNHKQTYFDITSNSKAHLSLRSNQIQGYDFTNSLSKSFDSQTLGLSTKVNHKREANARVTHAVRWWDNDWKLKTGVEVDWKKELVCSANANLERKGSLQNREGWLRLVSKYSYRLGIGANVKSNLRKKLETYYQSNFITTENHKAYLQHKFSYEPHNPAPFSHLFAFNCQEALGIGTFNGSISFENFAIKNKEVRLVLEFEKKWVLGLQRKNELYELVMQRNKVGYSWLKHIKANVGNKGLYASLEGKVNLFKVGVDYTVSYKLKPLQQNFYDDSSLGFSLKWNI